MAIGFVIFWVAVGLGVFFVAMRGGSRAAREPSHTESKASRRTVIAVVVVLMAFGIVVPTLVLAFNGAHKASVAPGGLTLTAQQQHGRELFARACATCHTLSAARSVGRVGPNLDVLIPTTGDTKAKREAYVLNAITYGRARGMGQKPAMLYQGQDAQAVADFVSTVAGR
jgi:mono/diheme cytochrome c family protein